MTNPSLISGPACFLYATRIDAYDALAPGSATPGTYTEMNERQDPRPGPCRDLLQTGDYCALTLRGLGRVLMIKRLRQTVR